MLDDVLIRDIFLLFPMVRYAAIWQDDVKLHGGMKDDLESYFDDEVEQSSIAHQISRWHEDNETDTLGKKRYTLIVKERVRLYTINLNKNKFLMISTEPDEFGDGLINSILELNNSS